MALAWAALAVETGATGPSQRAGDKYAGEHQRDIGDNDRSYRTDEPAIDAAGETTEASLRNLICQPIFTWPCEEAVEVFRCESVNFQPDVVYGPTEGAAGERGIVQLHPVNLPLVHQLGYTWSDMFIPEKNLEVGYALWEQRGWAAWSCAP